MPGFGSCSKVKLAIDEGELIKLDTCELCGDKPEPITYKRGGKTFARSRIEAHHWNGHYNPLDVWFICRRCNSLLRGHRFHSGTVSKDQTIEYIKSYKTQP